MDNDRIARQRKRKRLSVPCAAANRKRLQVEVSGKPVVALIARAIVTVRTESRRDRDAWHNLTRRLRLVYAVVEDQNADGLAYWLIRPDGLVQRPAGGNPPNTGPGRTVFDVAGSPDALNGLVYHPEVVLVEHAVSARITGKGMGAGPEKIRPSAKTAFGARPAETATSAATVAAEVQARNGPTWEGLPLEAEHGPTYPPALVGWYTLGKGSESRYCYQLPIVCE